MWALLPAVGLLGLASAINVEHPGVVTGYDALFSRRLNRYYYQHRLSKDVAWDKPAEPAPEAVFWWMFKNEDCGYDDIEDQCVGDTLAVCKQKCASNPECGGFNFPHGIMKKKDCLQKKTASTTDLYIKEDHAQPPPPPPASNFPPIWPHPKQFTAGSANISVVGGSAFTLTATTASKDLTGAFARFTKNCFPHPTAGTEGNLTAAAGLTGVTVTATDVSGTLQLDTDESYTLDVPLSGTATITAATVFGAMHGLETLSQLVYFDFDTESYKIDRAPWHIDDEPRFQHREVLVDTSRHFEPVETLKKLVQSLTYAKVNTVHWHLVDQQSFPFDSTKRPELSRKGAYSPQERYTPLDVAEVVEFGRARGVRMMVEIDGPGHAAIWCKGYPEICPSATCLEPLNPATNATFDLLDDLLEDLTGGTRGSGLFFDNVIHLGGASMVSVNKCLPLSLSPKTRVQFLT